MNEADGMSFESEESIQAGVKRLANGAPDEEHYLKRDEDAIATCHGIALMPGWEHSEGCAREIAKANQLLKPVRLLEEWFLDVKKPNKVREVIVEDPKTGGRKARKLARFDLVPLQPLWELAEHYGKCGGDGNPENNKYGERNWEKGYLWSLSFSAAMRHIMQFWMREDIDPENGSKHLIAAAWHCMNLVEFCNKGLGTDDRPPMTT